MLKKAPSRFSASLVLAWKSVIVGVVGVLQFEVLEQRLKNEYNVEVRRQGLPYSIIRWVANPEEVDVPKLNLTHDTYRVENMRGEKLLLFTSEWNLRYGIEHNPNLELSRVWQRFLQIAYLQAAFGPPFLCKYEEYNLAFKQTFLQPRANNHQHNAHQCQHTGNSEGWSIATHRLEGRCRCRRPNKRSHRVPRVYK